MAPLSAAVRAEGLKFGLYYSQAQDWTHPGGGKYGGKNWDPAQDGDYDHYLQTIALPRGRSAAVKRVAPLGTNEKVFCRHLSPLINDLLNL